MKFVKLRVCIEDAIPGIRSRFTRVDPRIFPRLSSNPPLLIAMIDVTSSGIVMTIAMKKKPSMEFSILYLVAKSINVSMSSFPIIITSTRDIINERILNFVLILGSVC